VVDGLSDHRAILVSLKCVTNSSSVSSFISRRLYHRLDDDRFLTGICSITSQVCSSLIPLLNSNGETSNTDRIGLNSIYKFYNESVETLVDNCTPIRTIRVPRSSVPWWTDKLHRLRCLVRRAECRWMTSRLTVFNTYIDFGEPCITMLLIKLNLHFFRTSCQELKLALEPCGES
jgi:hypothetical protein